MNKCLNSLVYFLLHALILNCNIDGGQSQVIDPFISPYFFPRRPRTRPPQVTVPINGSNCQLKLNCKPFFSQRYPTIDGTCNNRVDPKRGIINHSFKRFLPADYIFGDLLRRGPLPRRISNAFKSSPSESSINTQMLPFFGQFLAHDFTLTLGPGEEETQRSCPCDSTSRNCMNIPIPFGDPQRRVKSCFRVSRSTRVRKTEDCKDSVREQSNELTGFLDMGVIYGTSNEQLQALRDKSPARPGQLISKPASYRPTGRLLPQIGDSFQLQPAASKIMCPHSLIQPRNAACFISGEPRTNENSVLASHHTVWMKLHNKVVRGLRRVNPSWNSDKLFETARSIIIALEQRLAFTHFLPEIIGPRHMKMFQLNALESGYWYGYDSSYDATIENSFATAAFRMGHPLINLFFQRPNPSYTGAQGPAIRVKDALNNVGVLSGITPGTARAGGPNSFIRGLAAENSLKFDTTFSEDLRDFLDSEAPQNNTFGSDLLARNIQRGRDHGLPPYVKYREFCGLSVPYRFTDLKGMMRQSTISKLQQVYSNVEEIDLFVGGVSEISLEQATVGPTFACIIAYQFRDAKRGDRFWHENPPPLGMFSKVQLQAIRFYDFPKILCDVVDDMRTIQPLPLRQASRDNRRKACSSYTDFDFRPWRENQRNSDESAAQDTVWTTWFPTCVTGSTFADCENELSASETYDWLRVNRPTEICNEVLNNQIRTVGGRFGNRRQQIRFECLPGTIRHSDFPVVPSEKYYWSSWVSSSISHYQEQSQCGRPYAVQVQARSTSQGRVPAGETGQVFSEFSPIHGVACEDNEQINSQCENYFVRFLCRLK